MEKYVFAVLGGMLLGFLLAKIIKIVRMNSYHKDVVDSLVRSLTLEEECAQAMGKSGMIDHVVETKGIDYAILYYGSIYHLLQGVSKKDEQTQRLEDALAQFLHRALKKDIEAYRKAQETQSKADGKTN